MKRPQSCCQLRDSQSRELRARIKCARSDYCQPGRVKTESSARETGTACERETHDGAPRRHAHPGARPARRAGRTRNACARRRRADRGRCRPRTARRARRRAPAARIVGPRAAGCARCRRPVPLRHGSSTGTGGARCGAGGGDAARGADGTRQWVARPHAARPHVDAQAPAYIITWSKHSAHTRACRIFGPRAPYMLPAAGTLSKIPAGSDVSRLLLMLLCVAIATRRGRARAHAAAVSCMRSGRTA